MRAYTIQEIDAMRGALNYINGYRGVSLSIGGQGLQGPVPNDYFAQQESAQAARKARIEDELRTLMAGGVEPETVLEKAAAIHVGLALRYLCLPSLVQHVSSAAPAPPPPPIYRDPTWRDAFGHSPC